MEKPTILNLGNIELIQQPGGLVLQGLVAPAQDETTPAPEILLLGVGQAAPPIPDEIQTAFTGVFVPPPPAPLAMWLTPANPLPPGSPQVLWYGHFSTESIDLYGLQTFTEADASALLQLPPLRFSGMVFKAALRISGGVVQSAFFACEAQAFIQEDLGPIGLKDLEGRFGLVMEISAAADLGVLIANPSRLLDSAFHGQATLEAQAQAIDLFDTVTLTQPSFQARLKVVSPAGSRAATIEALEATLAAQQAHIGGNGVRMEALSLSSALRGWQPGGSAGVFTLDGSALVHLPASLTSHLQSNGVDLAQLQANLHCQHTTQGTLLELQAPQVQLNEALNFLAIQPGDLRIMLLRGDAVPAEGLPGGGSLTAGDWTFAFEGRVLQSWSRLAENLNRTGKIHFPTAGQMPNVRAHLFALGSFADNGRLELGLDLDLVEASSSQTALADLSHYRGPLGPLPVMVADMSIQLRAAFGSQGLGSFTAGGRGTLSTNGDLKTMIPLNDASLSVEVSQAAPDGIPILAFMLSRLDSLALELPSALSGGDPITLFKPISAALTLGETLQFEMQVGLIDGLSGESFARLLGISGWEPLFTPVFEAINGVTGVLTLEVPGAAGSTSLQTTRLEILLEAAPDRSYFGFFHSARAMLKDVLNLDTSNLPDFELILMRPGGLRFAVSFGGQDSMQLQLSGWMDCKFFNEDSDSFDVTLGLALVEDQAEISLLLGVTDPINLDIPSADFAGLFDSIDVQVFLEDRYGTLQPDLLRQVSEAQRALVEFFSQPGLDTSMRFELRQVGIRFHPANPDAPISISGQVRPTQLPEALQKVLPEVPIVTLGASPSSIYLEFSMGDTSPTPLLDLPLGKTDVGAARRMKIFLDNFQLAYDWTTNSIAGGIKTRLIQENIEIVTAIDPRIGNGILLPMGNDEFDSFRMEAEVNVVIAITPVGPIPIPVPQWDVRFGDPLDQNNLGLQIVVGTPQTQVTPHQRLITAYLRQSAFSLNRFPLSPGLIHNGGFILGTPPTGSQDRRKAFARLESFNAQFLLMNPIVAVIMNPLVVIPPFVTPLPPYMISPTHFLMGDVYFDELTLEANLPDLFHFHFTFIKPMPAFTAEPIIELVFMILDGFRTPIPRDSALRAICFIKIDTAFELTLPPELFPNADPLALALKVEFSAVDFIRLVQETVYGAMDMLRDGSQMLMNFFRDPALLVRLIPYQHRTLELESELNLPAVLSFAVSGSVYLLLPDEMGEELRAFHEETRPARQGLAAARRTDDWEWNDNLPAHNLSDRQGSYATEPEQLPFQGFAIKQPLARQVISYPRLVMQDPRSALDGPSLPVARLVEDARRWANRVFAQDMETAGVIRSLEELIEQKYTQGLVRAIQDLAALAPQDPFLIAKIHNLLVRHDLAHSQTWLLSYLRRNPLRGDANPSAVQRWSRQLRQAWLEELIRTQVIMLRMPGRMAASAETIASNLVNAIVTNNIRPLRRLGSSTSGGGSLPAGGTLPATAPVDGGGGGPSRRFCYTIANASDRQMRYQLLRAQFPGLASSITTAIDSQFATQPVSGCFETLGELNAFKDQLAAAIVGIVQDQDWRSFPLSLRSLRLPETVLEGIDFEQCIRMAFQNSPLFDPTPGSATLQTHVTILDPFRTIRLLSTSLHNMVAATEPWGFAHDLAGDPTVREIQGYKIEPRQDGLLRDVIFEEPVPDPRTPFRVVFRNGQYVLEIGERLERSDGHSGLRYRKVTLPDALTNPGLIPLGPGKARMLRAQLHIVPNVVTRTASQREMERAHPAQRDESSNWRNSIFARPEYRLGDNGGVHSEGFFLGDLLRISGRNSNYLVPLGPVLAAGVRADLSALGIDAQMQMAGLLAPGPRTSNLFLYGNSELAIDLGGGYTLDLKGDFHVLTGTMWPSNLSGGFEKDSLSFKGLLQLKRRNTLVLQGEAAGWLRNPRGNLELSMRAGIFIDHTVELRVGELKIANAWISDTRLEMEIGLGQNGFRASIQGSLDVKVAFPKVEIVEEQITPPLQVCVDSHCFSTPPVKAPALKMDSWGPTLTVKAHFEIISSLPDRPALTYTLTFDEEVQDPDNPTQKLNLPPVSWTIG